MSRFCGNPSTHAIVLQRFRDIQFHQWHVLMGRGMKDHVWPILLHDERQAANVGYVADHRTNKRAASGVIQFFAYRVEAVFMALIQDEMLRPQYRYLTREFRTD